MNCLKFHCPAGLGGAAATRVCFRKHLLQFGMAAATPGCMNSLKQSGGRQKTCAQGSGWEIKCFPEKMLLLLLGTGIPAELWHPSPPAGRVPDAHEHFVPPSDPELHPEHPYLGQKDLW